MVDISKSSWLTICILKTSEAAGGKQVEVSNTFGATKLKFSGRPFGLQNGVDDATLAKVFAVKAFEEIYALGYDFIGSADLSRILDHGTWFFTKGQYVERQKKRFVCISPGGFDKLIVSQGDESIVSAVTGAIKEAWALGIQNENSRKTKYGNVHEFKLRGNPWAETGAEAAMCRRLLLNIIGSMGQLQWKLLASTNLKGGIDAMLFVYDEKFSASPKDYAMLSLNRQDRLRLIKFDESIRPIVKQSIMNRYQQKTPSEQVYHQAYEFKLKGYPFACSGDASVASRRLICDVLADLSKSGWECIDTMIITRRLTDKSVFIMQRSQPLPEAKFACVALTSSDHLRFVDFPAHVTESLKKTVIENYMPGIEKEKEEDPNCIKLYLNHHPWAMRKKASPLHARLCLMKLLEVAAMHGWYLKASADVSAKYVHQKNGPDYPLDVDSWFFCYYGKM